MPPFLAPLLAQGLDLVANFALTKGKAALEQVTGVKIPDDGKLSNEQVTTLKKYQMEHEEALANIRLENNKLDLEAYKVQVADTSSARDREVKINESANASWLAKNTSAIAGLSVMLAFFFFAFLSVFDFGIAVRETAFNTVFMAVYGMATLYGGYLWGASKPQKDIAIGGVK